MSENTQEPQDPFEAEVDRFLASKENLIPGEMDYDWRPFLTALAEGNKSRNGVNRINMLNATSIEGQDGYMGPVSTCSSGTGIIDEIPKQPDTGSWDFSLYIPEWSHPAFDPDLLRLFTGEVRHLINRDPIHRLYPALRAVDLVKGPTEWALRYGIHPEETGGRSRLSPTLSHTRNPFEHLAQQVSLLSPDSRRLLLDESRKAVASRGLPPPDDPNYIDPNLLETMLAQQGVVSRDELKDKLRQTLKSDNFPVESTNLEYFINELNQYSPDTVNLHTSYLEAALNDQDFQRLLFRDMTSDELVNGGFFSTTEPFVCDLQNEIHSFFTKYHWSTTTWRGTNAHEPRWLYNLNGERHEWAAKTNDDIWQAITPALRLASNLISFGHTVFNDLADLTHRLEIPPELDNREHRPHKNMYWFTKERKPDLAGTPPGVPELDKAGFDWIRAVVDVLDHTLAFDFHSGWLDLVDEDRDAGAPHHIAHESDGFSYGTTRLFPDGPKSRIVIFLAPELVWPLLVSDSQYNGSEKLVASFLLASSMVHELAHAITQAHTLLIYNRAFALSMGHSEWTVNQLARMKGIVSAPGSIWGVSEPFYPGHHIQEAGYATECALFGYPSFTLTHNILTKSSRHLCTLPFIATQTPWPFHGDDQAEEESYIKNAVFAPIEYTMPIDIEHMAKFFRQNFWEVDVINFGPHALKMKPGRRAFKTIAHQEDVNRTHGINAFGAFQYLLIYLAQRLLFANEHYSLGTYIWRSTHFALMPQFYLSRFNREYPRWQKGFMKDIDDAATNLNQTITDGHYLLNQLEADQVGLNFGYNQYVTRRQQSGSTVLDPTQWLAEMQGRATEMFRRGGTLIRALQDLYASFVTEGRYMQRLVFDCFDQIPNARRTTMASNGTPSRGWESIQVIKRAYLRMRFDRDRLVQMMNSLTGVLNHATLNLIKEDYKELEGWFLYAHNILDELIKMLEDPPPPNSDDTTWKKRFASVPSSFWKNGLDRAYLPAHREYMRSDPRIRAVVDRALHYIRESLKDKNRVRTLGGHDPNVDDIDLNVGLGNSFPKIPPSESVTDLIPPTPPVPPEPSNDPSSNNNLNWPNADFSFNQTGRLGEPSLLGVAPPRRGDANAAPFSAWATGAGFGGANQGAAQGTGQNPFGQGGPIDTPMGTEEQTMFQPRGESMLFPYPGAREDITVSDVQYYNELQASKQSEQPSQPQQTYATNEGWRDQPIIDAGNSPPTLADLAAPPQPGPPPSGQSSGSIHQEPPSKDEGSDKPSSKSGNSDNENSREGSNDEPATSPDVEDKHNPNYRCFNFGMNDAEL